MTHTCDYLVIGGGSAGCILAKRLAERTSGRIILLEAGKADEGDPAATDLSRLDEQTSAYDWGFRASTIAGSPPALNYLRAKLLGGCANHNDCAFIRPPDSDFDLWDALGAKGWSAADMAPLWGRILSTVTVEPAPQHQLSRAFVAAGCELGLAEVDFRKGAQTGVGWFPLNAKAKFRQSSSVVYLHPLANLPHHLEVWTETFASHLAFDGNLCTGAETSRGLVTARRGVILTAGAIQTPQLLMLSGIGPANQLKSHGISVLADLPVGEHLLDHVAAPIVWKTHAPVEPWEICPLEATMMLTLEAGAPAPDVLFHFGLRVREKYGDRPRFPTAGPAVRASPNVTRAKSEGRVSLRSAHPTDPPVIEMNYLSDPYDWRILLAALRFTRRLFDTRAFKPYLSREAYPGSAIQSDEDWLAYVRDVCETVFHPCGTAAIGRVVTPDLRVKNTANLYVADASIFPSLITVNINSAVMMAAERAADLIAPTRP
jgi:choline dehydrogenase-like flavoprotein